MAKKKARTPNSGPKRRPAPTPKSKVDYDRFRDSQAALARERSQKGREIGAIPEIANLKRRTKASAHPKIFCETYLAPAFPLAFAPHHLDEFDRMHEAATLGAMTAIADPRGDGKTTRVRGFTLWAMANAYCYYALIVGANLNKAEEAIETLKLWMRFMPEFIEDYPEISVAIRALNGIAQRATGQTCLGESTLVEWGQTRIILPTVPAPPNWPKKWMLRSDGMVPTSGAIIGATGLTGEGIRGSVITTSDGRMLRPDLVLPDDPQTDESAHSKTQNATRLKLINSAILGLAGPGEKISAVMPCTVIARGDAIDQILDRNKNPLWRGVRRGILKSMPKNLGKWNEYFEVYDRCALKEPPDFTEANEYYKARRAELDEGAEATWEERKADDEVSAIQHAMHLFHRDPAAFWSEFMNQPLDEQSGLVSKKLEADSIKERLNNIPRLVVPHEATRLVAFIDCGKDLLWYAVAALDERFSGGLVDYGWFPHQPKDYFPKSNPPNTLADQYPNLDDDQLLYAALRDLAATILGRRYVRHQTDDYLEIERCLVDEGWNDKPVYQFCRESQFSKILMPSKGHVPKSLSHTPMSRWQAREGQRASKPGQPSWRVGQVGSGKGRHVIFEANEWKSFTAERFTSPAGGAGCMRLFGDESSSHAMIADHFTAEFATSVVVDGRRFERWQMKATRDDNDLFDCAVGCMVAASIQGLEWFANASGTSGTQPAPKRKLADVIAAKQNGDVVPAPATSPVGGGPKKKRKLADVIAAKQRAGSTA